MTDRYYFARLFVTLKAESIYPIRCNFPVSKYLFTILFRLIIRITLQSNKTNKPIKMRFVVGSCQLVGRRIRRLNQYCRRLLLATLAFCAGRESFVAVHLFHCVHVNGISFGPTTPIVVTNMHGLFTLAVVVVRLHKSQMLPATSIRHD